MTPLFLFRLFLDLMAVSLLLAAMAYNWSGNVLHEIMGTVMFMLLLSHNIFNRRWYGTITRDRRETRGVVDVLVKIAAMANPPRQFVAGSDAVAVVRPALEARLEELRAYEELSKTTDGSF